MSLTTVNAFTLASSFIVAPTDTNNKKGKSKVVLVLKLYVNKTYSYRGQKSHLFGTLGCECEWSTLRSVYFVRWTRKNNTTCRLHCSLRLSAESNQLYSTLIIRVIKLMQPLWEIEKWEMHTEYLSGNMNEWTRFRDGPKWEDNVKVKSKAIPVTGRGRL
jgi:hypothetical protein